MLHSSNGMIPFQNIIPNIYSLNAFSLTQKHSYICNLASHGTISSHNEQRLVQASQAIHKWCALPIQIKLSWRKPEELHIYDHTALPIIAIMTNK